jgi:hypothetical protein
MGRLSKGQLIGIGSNTMFRSSILSLFIVGLACGLASAATITNKDGEAVLLVVTEGGQKTEVGIEPGKSITVCGGGCFVTMPNGDRETLSGGETVEIVGGKATIK